MEHQLAGWALRTGNAQGEEHVFLVRHKCSSCFLAVSLPGREKREVMSSGGTQDAFPAVPGRPEQKALFPGERVCEHP